MSDGSKEERFRLVEFEKVLRLAIMTDTTMSDFVVDWLNTCNGFITLWGDYKDDSLIILKSAMVTDRVANIATLAVNHLKRPQARLSTAIYKHVDVDFRAAYVVGKLPQPVTAREQMNAKKELQEWFERSGIAPELWQPLLPLEDKIV